MAGGWMRAGLARRGRRLGAAAVAIIIATTFMAATAALLFSALDGVRQTAAGDAAVADLVVRPDDGADGSPGLTAGQIAELAELDEVERVSTDSVVFGETTSDGSGETFMLAGPTMVAPELVEGRLPAADGEVAVNARAADGGLTPGDALEVTGYDVAADGSEESTVADLTVVGVVRAQPTSLMAGVSGGYTTASTLEELAPSLTHTTVMLDLADGASREAVAEHVHALGDGLEIVEAGTVVEDRVKDMTADLLPMGAILVGFGGVATVTAAIVIANTFTITLAQRRTEIALLRCVGAARGQVRRQVLLEAVLLGLVAGTVGVVLGRGLAWGLVQVADRAEAGIPLDGVTVSLWGVLPPLALAVLVTVAASLLPAMRATRVPPLAALRPDDPVPTRSAGRLRVAGSVLVFLIGVGLMALGTVRREVLLGVLGGTVSFAGVLAAAVVLVPALVRAAGPVARMTGVPGRLAVDNATRNPGRAAATGSALLVGVTLITMTLVGASSAERTIVAELDSRVSVDLVALQESVTFPEEGESDDGSSTDAALGRFEPLAPAAVERAEAMEDVEVVRPRRAGLVELTTDDGDWSWTTAAMALDADDADVVRSPEALEALEPGTIGLSRRTLESSGTEVGETVTVRGPAGSADLRIVPVNIGQIAALSTQEYTDLVGDTPETAMLLRVDDRPDLARVNADTQDLQDLGLTVEGPVMERAAVRMILDVLVLITSALLGVAVLIAVVGIANTLSLSIIERHREHALLRGLGLTREQMRRMLLVESVLLAGVATALGLVLGIGYAGFGVQSLLPEGMGVELDLPLMRLGLVIGLALLAGVLASVVPARRAARVAPAAGLAQG